MIAIYVTALTMGIMGSLHCAGMCGPIMLFMPFMQFKGWQRALGIGLYHLGRITAYALLSLFIYSFRGVFSPRLQQLVSVAVGGSLFIIGFLSILPLGTRWQIKLPWANVVRRKLAWFMSTPGFIAVSVSGFLNGLLPCGLVYLALSATLSLHTPLQAFLFMFFFGLGTLPALISIILFGNRLPVFKRLSLSKLAPVTVVLFGCVFALRGLNLGIPYLSPKIEVSKGEIHACCHKK